MIGIAEIIIVIVIVVFIVMVSSIPRLGIGEFLDRWHEAHDSRPLRAAGRIDADDRFRTQDWMDAEDARRYSLNRWPLSPRALVLAVAAAGAILLLVALGRRA